MLQLLVVSYFISIMVNSESEVLPASPRLLPGDVSESDLRGDELDDAESSTVEVDAPFQQRASRPHLDSGWYDEDTQAG